jgi:hypothetical protein
LNGFGLVASALTVFSGGIPWSSDHGVPVSPPLADEIRPSGEYRFAVRLPSARTPSHQDQIKTLFFILQLNFLWSNSTIHLSLRAFFILQLNFLWSNSTIHLSLRAPIHLSLRALELAHKRPRGCPWLGRRFSFAVDVSDFPRKIGYVDFLRFFFPCFRLPFGR